MNTANTALAPKDGGGDEVDRYIDQEDREFKRRNAVMEMASKIENNPQKPGGVRGALQEMLEKKLDGKLVDTSTYRGFLEYTMENGKMEQAENFYFAIMGVKEGFMSIDQLHELNGKYCNMHPWTETFREIKEIHDIRQIASEISEGAKPGKKVQDYFWDVVLEDQKVLERNSKGLRSNQIDHDHSTSSIPFASAAQMEQVTLYQSGTHAIFTAAGFSNAYPGFAERIRRLAEKKSSDAGTKISQTLRAFLRYDGILSDTEQKGKPNYFRFTNDDFNKPTIVSGQPTRTHQTQLHELISKIAKAYEIPDSVIKEKGQKLEDAIRDTVDQKGAGTMIAIIQKITAEGKLAGIYDKAEASHHGEKSVADGQKDTHGKVEKAVQGKH